MTKQKRARIEMIDVAKAITIFLVILGHTTGNLETPMFRRMLYSFHMPLFFFLAGMSIKPSPLSSWAQWRAFLRKNILALVVPYLIWALIYAPFSVFNIPSILYGSWAALGNVGTLTSLWYLTSFFVARVLAQSLVSLLHKAKVNKMTLALGVCSVPMFAIGFLLPEISGGYPWCANVSFVAAGCILLGMALRTPILILAQQKTLVLGIAGGVSLLAFLGGTLLRGDALELSLMCAGIYGNVFWFLFNSTFGTMTVLTASMLLLRISREGHHPFSVSMVTYIGQHTMGLYLLHKNILQELIIPWLRSWLPGPQLLTAFLGACVAFAVGLLLCRVIEKYVPQLLGQFPRYS